MKTTIAIFTLALLFAGTDIVSAQAARYPAIARAMARDGYATRQKAAVAGIKKESMDLNVRGFALYQKKDYPGAAELFTLALAADAENVFARYNLACALSLAWGEADPRDTPFPTRAALVKAVVRLLAAAAAADVHWAYKIFVDPDLDALRGEPFAAEAWYPCPGDCCPDQWYTYRPDGTVVYGAGPTDLSGIPGHESRPTAETKGWYAAIGDYVFVHMPGQEEILRALWPGLYSTGDESGGDEWTGLELFQVRRVSGRTPEIDRQADVWDE